MEEEQRRVPVRAAIWWRVLFLVLLGAAYGILFYSLPPKALNAMPASGGALSLYQRQMIAFAVSAVVTLRAMLAPAGGRMVSVAGLEAVATAAFGGVIFSDWRHLEEEKEAVVGQSTVAVMVMGELALLAGDCVRLRA